METKPRLLQILDVVTAVLFAVAVGMVFFYAPMERTMGQVQRVFYFHVATAWVGMLGFLVAAVVGVLYLVRKERRWDIVGLAAIEISLVFFFITIVSGSIWARPSWGTWWTWDPRLTTALIMELIYAAYLLLRSGIDDPLRRAKLSAVYAIVGFTSVPLTFISIRIFRTIHPVIVGSADPSVTGSFAMSARMQTAFFGSLAAFTILFAALYWHRYRLGLLQAEVQIKRDELETWEDA